MPSSEFEKADEYNQSEEQEQSKKWYQFWK